MIEPTQSSPHEQVAGNFYNKYASKNPVARHLMANFLKSFSHLFLAHPVNNLLEVGCGEGYLLSYMKQIADKDIKMEGIDNSEEIISIAKNELPDVELKVASAIGLPFSDGSYELVIACEVLEHIEQYQMALTEINRVGSKYFIFSVPREPVWRVMNVLRLKYLKSLGNTPGHVNHWSKNDFVQLISRHFNVKEILMPFPWTMVLATKK